MLDPDDRALILERVERGAEMPMTHKLGGALIRFGEVRAARSEAEQAERCRKARERISE